MDSRDIVIADSYDYPERPLFVVDLANRDLSPFVFDGKIVRTTFKAVPDDDPVDAAAVIKADIRFGDDGAVTSSNGLVVDASTPGRLLHYLTAEESAQIPVGTPYISDVQISRYDAALGREVGVYTFLLTGILTAKLGVTNRTGGA